MTVATRKGSQTGHDAATLVHYQPMINLSVGDGRGRDGVAAVEALLRPLDLDRIATDNRLAARTVDAALRDALPFGQLSVNIERPHLQAVLDELNTMSAMLPWELRIEITERHGVPSADELHAIRACGFTTSIDDVSAGDLDAVIGLQPDEIKFGPEWLDELDALRTGIRNCGEAGIGVVLECIETEAQYAFARSAGASGAQGWFWAPALPSKELVAWPLPLAAATPPRDHDHGHDHGHKHDHGPSGVAR